MAHKSGIITFDIFSTFTIIHGTYTNNNNMTPNKNKPWKFYL